VKNITKENLVEFIHRKTGADKTELRKHLDSFISIIRKHIIAGRTVQIRGFGTFTSKMATGRPVMNPGTGQKLWMDPHRRAVFKFSRDIKLALRTLKGGK